ncbi:type I secretion system permease/ATPase [Hoeflea sp. YIM 152468]|uniref:type I secretion system permease/ATPase n=1 Tax=Hoeflea sp. YIM 152468 TaxID=3031759 RepID=UPI0023D987C3|nr:type I secretion system permease/ATPase [Hoeflea sp. YIM 152468]MDF1610097.1 type I secretion system permease/ATPase [Hoeflea sp. YIM 152468]
MKFDEAFREVSVHYERSGSGTVLFSGIPDDKLEVPDLETVREVSSRIGLDVAELRLTDLFGGNANLPVLIRTLGGGFIPVFGYNDDGTFACRERTGGAAAENIDLRARAADFDSTVLDFKKVYFNNQEEAGALHAGKIEKEHWLFAAVRPYWRSFVRVGFAAFFINILALASPLFVMNVYDRVLPNEAIATLWVLAIGIGVAFTFDFLLKYARASLIDYTGRKIDLKIAYILFQKVMNTSLSVRSMSTGEYVSRVSQYEFVREFFTSNTIATMIDTCFVFIFIAVVYAIGGPMAYVPAVALVAVTIIGLVAQNLISRRVVAAANEAALRQSMLVETIYTTETVKGLRAEGVLLKRWRDLTINSSATNEQIKSISAFAVNATQFVQQLVTVGIILVGAYLFQEGVVSTGAIIAAVILSGRAVSPLGQLAMTLARFRQALLSLRILDNIMGQAEDTPETTGFVNRVIARGDIAFEAVHFRYPEADQDALDGLSFSVRAGEKVGIIGRIGSGKTTIGRLMSRLYQPREGRVLVDGIDMQQFHPSEVRSAVAVAGQTSDLFSGSLKDNLLMGNPKATDEDLIEVSRTVGIESFIVRHPRGFDMPVGENGSNLSAGQKQAVAIARLLLADPKIVFLDEPSGAMDLASERHLISCLRKAITPDVTLVLSTHRYSMLDLIDRLIVIENGKLLADGPKEQVIAALQRKTNGVQ